MFCDRQTTQELAEALAERLTVINYNRRGRGESGDTAPYTVEREVEDLGALIDEVGGSASVYAFLGRGACPGGGGPRIAHHPAGGARAPLRTRR
jgi:hypothetical protein